MIDLIASIMRNICVKENLTFAAVLALLSVNCIANAQVISPFSAKPVTINVQGKVLSDTLNKVQLAFQSPINYEEIPLDNSADMQVLATSDLAVTLTALDTTPYLATESVINAYIQSGFPGTYTVIQREKRVDVLPARVRSANGSIREPKPLLTLPLTFPRAQRTLGDTIQLILDAVSKQSGYRVLVIHIIGFPYQPVELGATGESTGDVFENLAATLHTVLAVRFLYEPNEKTYYLDLEGVFPPDTPGQPADRSGKKIVPNRGSEPNPFFTKTK